MIFTIFNVLINDFSNFLYFVNMDQLPEMKLDVAKIREVGKSASITA